MAASQIWAWRFFRRIHLPSLERGNEEGEDEGNKENAEGIQASGEGLGGFISIDNFHFEWGLFKYFVWSLDDIRFTSQVKSLRSA